MTMLWLPFIRGPMDGQSYEWDYVNLLSGNGVKGDYWILVVVLLFGFLVQYFGWRGARWPFHLLLITWNLPALYFSIGILLDPGEYTFQGDTLGISFELGFPIILLYGGTFILVIFWVIKDLYKRRKSPRPPWTLRNRKLLYVALALLPFQFLLLRFGKSHGLTDKVGVLLTIVQWLLLVASLYPWTPPPKR